MTIFALREMALKIDISTVLRDLLFRHDCVIIPGFGGFICNYVPASVDSSSSLFHPPSRKISFNRNLSHNDGLLTGRISTVADISFEEAAVAVNSFVAAIKRDLANGKTVELPLIGLFRLNKEGSVQFDPEPSSNYNLSSFGMEPIRCEPVAGYDVRREVVASRKVSPSKMLTRRMLVRAAVAVPVLIALVAVPLKTDIFSGRVSLTSLNPLVKAELEDNKRAVGSTEPERDGITAGEEDKTITMAEAHHAVGDTGQFTGEDKKPDSDGTDSSAEAVAKGKYCLIAGSFSSEANARVMAQQLISSGYSPVLLSAPGGFTRVSVETYNDRAAAVSARDRISEDIPDTWILKK